MGTHAKPRTRVRTAALGTLAVGATLTGVGLTAAVLDPAGASLADGTQSADPVNLAASGLGAPVPVADVNAVDAASPGIGAQSNGNVPSPGGRTDRALSGSGRAVKPGQVTQEPTWPHGAAAGGEPEHETPQGGAANAASPNGGPATAAAGSGASNSSAGNSSAANHGGPGSGAADSNPIAGLLPNGQVSDLSAGLGSAESTVASLLGELAGLI